MESQLKILNSGLILKTFTHEYVITGRKRTKKINKDKMQIISNIILTWQIQFLS